MLEKSLKSKRKKCMIGTGAMCDPYLHIEEKLGLTRKCLELIDQYEYGIAIQTKSSRILRDMDLLVSINKKAKTVVQMTMTTYDESLCKILEPNVSTTEENVSGILEYCIEAGVKGIICFDMGVTLREGDREYFYQALDRHFPGLKGRYISTYGNSYNVSSPNNKKLMKLFHERCSKNGIISDVEACFRYLNEFPDRYEQLSLFDF